MKIIVDPGKVWTMEALPANSIALDGAVPGIALDTENRRYSFDHHGAELRFALSATCRQVLDALLLGLDVSGMTLYLNHLDGDVVLAVWILEHAELWQDARNLERLRPLLDVVAENDAHGPAYPVRNPDLAAQYHLRILSPLRKKPEGASETEKLGTTLAQALDTLEAWWASGLPVLPTASEPEKLAFILERHAGWVFVRSDLVPGTTPSRLTEELYAQGHKRLLLCSSLSPGRWKYTLAKRSDFVDRFDLKKLYARLNAAEIAGGGKGEWGNASTIGGSPRPDGSLLPPEIVVGIVGTTVGEEALCAR